MRKQQAEVLRQDHLAHRLEIAKEKGDDEAIAAIKRIIKKERKKQAWIVAGRSHGKPRARSVMAAQVADDQGYVSTTYDTQEGVEEQAAADLGPRFRLSASAPIFSSPLMEHVGILGDKPAVKQILNGTFDFPPGTDRWTIAIMKEACTVFQHMSPNDIVDLVTKDNFQEYWNKQAREATSSSKSDIHFGHYMAAALSDKLSSLLHAAKLSLAAKLGITLERWHMA